MNNDSIVPKYIRLKSENFINPNKRPLMDETTAWQLMEDDSIQNLSDIPGIFDSIWIANTEANNPKIDKTPNIRGKSDT